MLANKLMSALSGGTDTLYVDDVFSTYLYTGNGSTQTINNGIDLAGKGGLVWTKIRDLQSSNVLIDSMRGTTAYLYSDATASAGISATTITSLSSSGYALGSSGLVNASTYKYVAWTFRKAPKFFDVVTWTGNGVSDRAVPHSLGITPGIVIIKMIDSTSNWAVATSIISTDGYRPWARGQLNTTDGFSGNDNMQLYSDSLVPGRIYNQTVVGQNSSDATYVAYLFAHDPSVDGIIQCGSYSGNGSATGPIVNLGWEPQYLMIKSTSGGNWQIIDSMRGMSVGSADATLQANRVNVESSVDYISPTATGFQLTSTSSEVNGSGSTYIYLAIRRPNKPPTTGTQVYNAIARTGTGAAATVTGVGFAPDVVHAKGNANDQSGSWFDRLRGVDNMLQSVGTAAEVLASSSVTSFNNDGIGLGDDSAYQRINKSGLVFINHFFKRAPGVFDVVCYTGDGQSSRVINHGLGAVPTFAFIKERNGTAGWTVKLPTGNGSTSLQMALNSSLGSTFLFGDPSTATTFSVLSSGATGNTNAQANNSNKMYVAFLFASCPGISKVGSYTGNGSSQTIDCGFTTGARFILIKRTNAAGDWYVWDTARGIVSANDPHLSLNTTAAEVTTDDSVDPASSGFIVNQVAATDINVSGGQYIFLAIA